MQIYLHQIMLIELSKIAKTLVSRFDHPFRLLKQVVMTNILKKCEIVLLHAEGGVDIQGVPQWRAAN